MNINGRRTKLSIIITSPEFSVGNMANIIPIVAKQNEGNTKPRIKLRTLKICVSNHRSPMSNGITPIARLNRKPPRVLPIIIE